MHFLIAKCHACLYLKDSKRENDLCLDVKKMDDDDSDRAG